MPHDPAASDQGPAAGDKRCWLGTIRRYVLCAAFGHLIWEFAQMPLYTIAWQGELLPILVAGLHCTAGDIAITSTSLLLASCLVGSNLWPRKQCRPVLTVCVVIGVAYTVWSEYVNTVVRASWTYTEWMPVIPWFGTGLAPFVQWMVVPTFAMAWALRRHSSCMTAPTHSALS